MGAGAAAAASGAENLLWRLFFLRLILGADMTGMSPLFSGRGAQRGRGFGWRLVLFFEVRSSPVPFYFGAIVGGYYWGCEGVGRIGFVFCGWVVTWVVGGGCSWVLRRAAWWGGVKGDRQPRRVRSLVGRRNYCGEVSVPFTRPTPGANRLSWAQEKWSPVRAAFGLWSGGGFARWFVRGGGGGACRHRGPAFRGAWPCLSGSWRPYDQRSSSQVWPIRSLPKLRCGCSETR